MIFTLNGRGLGWRRQLPDHRDTLYTHQIPLAIARALPAAIDLRSHCPPVYDQGQLGSCTGNGVAFLLHFDLIAESLRKVEDLPPSRLMLYYGAREIEGTIAYDAGAQVRDALKAAVAGACFEDLWPYITSKFVVKPPPSAYEAAKSDRALIYRPVQQTSTAIRGCLASGYPVVFGFSCYEALDSEQVAATGLLPMPRPREHQIGGHCVALVGYDDASRLYLVRNSWGTSWGKGGYFLMPYEYVHRADLAADFWMIERAG